MSPGQQKKETTFATHMQAVGLPELTAVLAWMCGVCEAFRTCPGLWRKPKEHGSICNQKQVDEECS